MENEPLDLESERTALLAAMDASIDPELLKLLEELRKQPDETVSREMDVVQSEGTVYAGPE